MFKRLVFLYILMAGCLVGAYKNHCGVIDNIKATTSNAEAIVRLAKQKQDFMKLVLKNKEHILTNSINTLRLTDISENLFTLVEKQGYILQDVAAVRLSSVVQVNNFVAGKFGSGVFIADDLVLTAKHLVKDCNYVEVKLIDNSTYRTDRIYEADEDLALLVIKTDKVEQSIPFANVSVGQDVFAIGNPLGYFPSVTKGIVSALDVHNEGFGECGFIQTDCPLNPGNSGCPLFDMDGNIVGIYTHGAHRFDGIDFCVPALVCEEFLDAFSE